MNINKHNIVKLNKAEYIYLFIVIRLCVII